MANAGKPELDLAKPHGVESSAMAESDRRAPRSRRPVCRTTFDHRHADVSGGWLRAATFGAMDGLVSNTALIAGVAAGGRARTPS